jgi:hypothetical protein
MPGVDRPTGEDDIGPGLEADADDMPGVDRPTGEDDIGPGLEADADDMPGIDRPTGEDDIGPGLEADADDMGGIERPLNLEDDFAEGNMNEALFIPILVNDTIPGGELHSIFSFIVHIYL